MKSRILVLLDPSTVELKTEVARCLEPHRLDEDSIESIKAHHWDYWVLAHPGHLRDDELAATVGGNDDGALECAAFVRNLPPHYLPSGVITPDGSWHDLQDFGWRFLDHPSDANTEAEQRWESHFRALLVAFQPYIGVEVITHS